MDLLPTKRELYDPTFLFGAGCLLSNMLIRGDAPTMTLGYTPDFLSPAAWFASLTDPATLIGVCVYFVLKRVVRRSGKQQELTCKEQLNSNWYLWNAVIFHVMMDGLTGGFHLLKPMDVNYRILDRRMDETTGISDRSLVLIIFYHELIVHALMCAVTYYGTQTKAKWRQGAECFTLGVQYFGAVVFLFPSFLFECVDLVPKGVPGCLPKVTPYTFFYYYFGAGANFVWIVAPLTLGYYAMKSMSDDSSKKLKSKKQTTKTPQRVTTNIRRRRRRTLE